jgi:hypothetical protein
MNRHRDDLALVTDFSDFRRDSHVRARVPASRGHVIVRPTIVLTQDCRYEQRVEPAANALTLKAAKLQKLLAEQLTRPLGSMQTPRCFASDEAVTLVQSKTLEAPPVPYVRPSHEALSRHAYGLGNNNPAASAAVSFAPPPDRDLGRPAGRSHFDGATNATPRYEDGPDEAPPMTYALPGESRFEGAQTEMPGYELELEAESDTVLQRIRDHAHARLASLESAAASGNASLGRRLAHQRPIVSAHARAPIHGPEQRLDARPPRMNMGEHAQRRTARSHLAARSDAQHRATTSRSDSEAIARNTTPRSSATASARADAAHPVASPQLGRRVRARGESHGLTDARNALRSAYAASKLRSPSAPSRSSAKNAGIIDGWERLQGQKDRRTRTRAGWPWAAGLGACSMLLAYALTLSVVPQSNLTQPAAAIATVAAPAAAPTQPERDEPPSLDAPPVQATPRATTGTKPPKPPTRATPRMDCREPTPRTN